MTERMRLISCLLYGFFSAGKKTGRAFQYLFACARDHSRPRSLNRENSGRAIETRRDSKNSFFENETIFAFITPRSRSNLTLKIIFIMPGHYKKIMPAQQPIRARALLLPYNNLL